MKRIKVAVGIVFDQHGQVLVGQRVVKDNYFAKWEFPGGKLELGESSEVALKREFKEEVGIELGPCVPFMKISHDYPDRWVDLDVYTVDRFSGQLQALEGQALKWVSVAELNELDFLNGNRPMIEKLEKEFGVSAI